MSKIAVLSAPCEATGHPSVCTEPANGTVTEGNTSTSVRINGTTVANHADEMFFPSHGHDVSPLGACTNYQTHSLVPSDTGGISINDNRVMQEGDTQTDPGSGGTATIIGTGQAHQVVINGGSN
jgi:uncharacterized Zn-binding protein involved in type VI secretion